MCQENVLDVDQSYVQTKSNQKNIMNIRGGVTATYYGNVLAIERKTHYFS